MHPRREKKKEVEKRDAKIGILKSKLNYQTRHLHIQTKKDRFN
jgi:hypothetical protein